MICGSALAEIDTQCTHTLKKIGHGLFLRTTLKDMTIPEMFSTISNGVNALKKSLRNTRNIEDCRSVHCAINMANIDSNVNVNKHINDVVE